PNAGNISAVLAAAKPPSCRTPITAPARNFGQIMNGLKGNWRKKYFSICSSIPTKLTIWRLIRRIQKSYKTCENDWMPGCNKLMLRGGKEIFPCRREEYQLLRMPIRRMGNGDVLVNPICYRISACVISASPSAARCFDFAQHDKSLRSA